MEGSSALRILVVTGATLPLPPAACNPPPVVRCARRRPCGHHHDHHHHIHDRCHRRHRRQLHRRHNTPLPPPLPQLRHKTYTTTINGSRCLLTHPLTKAST